MTPPKWVDVDFSTLSKDRPRITIRQNQLADLRSAVVKNPVAKSLFAAIKRGVIPLLPTACRRLQSFINWVHILTLLLGQANGLLNTSPPSFPIYVTDGASQTVFSTAARTIYTRSTFLSVAYLVSGNRSYADAAMSDLYKTALALDSWVAWKECPIPEGPWQMSYFSWAVRWLDCLLATSYKLTRRSQIAFTHDYMQDYLTSDQKDLLWVNIRDKAMLPGLGLYVNGPYAPVAYMRNNWGITINSGLIVAALEFYEYDPKLAKNLIGYALRKRDVSSLSMCSVCPAVLRTLRPSRRCSPVSARNLESGSV
jgi:hypothetical protein